MANLRTAIDSQFWDQNVASPQYLDGCARSVPGDPFTLDSTRASRALRMQQLSILGNGFPLGIIPSYSYSPLKEHGSFCLQSLLLKHATPNWWVGLIGQFRPKKLVSSFKAEISKADEFGSSIKRVGKQLLDKSLYSLGLSTQFSLTPSTSLLLSTERHGDKKNRRYKLMLFHQLDEHDVTLEAAWPELFIDHKGRYWEVPESISLDMASCVSDSGLRYRFGLHKNSGDPHALETAIDSEVPSTLLSGLCAKAAFSYEKRRDLWRKKEKSEDVFTRTTKARSLGPYDLRLREPHSAISAIVGGTCEAWFGGREKSVSAQTQGGEVVTDNTRKRNPLSADLFGSACYIFQHGKFQKDYLDLTRVDARLDICSASALARKVFSTTTNHSAGDKENLLSSPRLNLILQQQIAGPIVFRVDSRFSLGASSTQMEDLVYSLSYALRLLRSGKVVAWYSPKRKEGMVELRLFEF